MFDLVTVTLLVLVTSAFSVIIDPRIDLDDEHALMGVIVTMKDSNSHILKGMTSRTFATREERLNTISKEAQEFASKSQEEILDFLYTWGQRQARHGKTEPEYKTLWISNQIVIKDGNAALVKNLSSRPDVEKIILDREIKFYMPFEDSGSKSHKKSKSDSEGDSDEGEDGPWGIEALNVPAVWEMGYRGEGVVVANMDSGVRHTHEALRSNFIGDGGWFDAGNGHLVPRDESGHGTKTMSLIAGTTRNIGVAPDSRWMACSTAAPTGSNTLLVSLILVCAQWLVCPNAGTSADAKAGNQDKDKDCGQVPHVINHSLALDYELENYMDKAILYYHAAGIIIVFSAGNLGPECCIIGYPGAHSYTIEVGATQKDNTVWTYSSRGPPSHDRKLIKPDFVAPGHLVRTADIKSNTAYKSVSGTSFSSPYTSGVVALMLSKNPNLNFKQVKEILIKSTLPTVTTGESCGKPDDEFPNFIAGHGRLDAKKAIEYMDTMKME